MLINSERKQTTFITTAAANNLENECQLVLNCMFVKYWYLSTNNE